MTKTRFIIYIFLSFLLIIWGCSPKVSQTENKTSVDISKVQQLTPYTLILPTYFPGGTGWYTSNITGPFEVKFFDKPYYEVRVTYNVKETTNVIWVDEINFESTTVPWAASYSNVDIKGVQVLVQETSMSGQLVINGVFYNWNQSGIGFQVFVSGFDKVESQKVVESMIK